MIFHGGPSNYPACTDLTVHDVARVLEHRSGKPVRVADVEALVAAGTLRVNKRIGGTNYFRVEDLAAVGGAR